MKTWIASFLLVIFLSGGSAVLYSAFQETPTVLDRLLNHEEQDRQREGRLAVTESYMADMKKADIRTRLTSVEVTQAALLTTGRYVTGLLTAIVGLLVSIVIFVQKQYSRARTSHNLVELHINELKDMRTSVSSLIKVVGNLSCLQPTGCPAQEKES